MEQLKADKRVLKKKKVGGLALLLGSGKKESGACLV